MENLTNPGMPPMQEQANVMSVKDWVITILIYAIPLVGFIMLFVWAFGTGNNPNLSNWAKAMLIWVAIGIALSIFFLMAFGGLLLATMDQFA